MRRYKALVVFGTRPEAIKMAPVVRALQATGAADVVTCSTGQHRDMVAPICGLFSVPIDHDLDIMRDGQSLTYVAAAVTEKMSDVIRAEKPDICLVQGDTTTAFAAALSAFYNHVPVAHVEAGLRTWDMDRPWPEEGNRVLIGKLAQHHFAPTEIAVANLLKEGVAPENILLTGNTVVDAAREAIELLPDARAAEIEQRFAGLIPDVPLILFTMHRRESFGDTIERVFRSLQQFCVTHNVQVLFPVHPNPNVAGPARAILGAQPNIHLVAPLEYDELLWALERSRFVITDSGGLVEEAATFGKPALVLRDSTERSESVEAGSAILCGSDTAKIAKLAGLLLEDGATYRAMSGALNPFGDGKAALRIATYLTDAAAVQAVAA